MITIVLQTRIVLLHLLLAWMRFLEGGWAKGLFGIEGVSSLTESLLTTGSRRVGLAGSACKQIHFFILCPLLYLGKPYQNVPCLADMHLMGTGDIMLAGNRELIVVFFDFENPSFVALGSLIQMRFQHIL